MCLDIIYHTHNINDKCCYCRNISEIVRSNQTFISYFNNITPDIKTHLTIAECRNLILSKESINDIISLSIIFYTYGIDNNTPDHYYLEIF
jgi:hypothetical protein